MHSHALRAGVSGCVGPEPPQRDFLQCVGWAFVCPGPTLGFIFGILHSVSGMSFYHGENFEATRHLFTVEYETSACLSADLNRLIILYVGKYSTVP